MSCRTQYRTPPGPPAPSIAHVANADRQQQAACQSGTILARFPAWIGSNMGNPSSGMCPATVLGKRSVPFWKSRISRENVSRPILIWAIRYKWKGQVEAVAKIMAVRRPWPISTWREAMNFDVFGGFTIEQGPGSIAQWRRTFWDEVRKTNQDLPEACGCYIFAVQHGSNLKPWYVGKTEKQTFGRRILQSNYLCNKLLQKPGNLNVFLIPALTLGGKFRAPRKSPSIDRLEIILIGLALQQNSELYNIQEATALKSMMVPGIINSGPGAPPAPVHALRNTLGLQ